MNIDLNKLQSETEKLLDLLKDRQPGLATWNLLLRERLENLKKLITEQEVWVLMEGNRLFKAEVYTTKEKAMNQVLLGSPEATFVDDRDITYAYIDGDSREHPTYVINRYAVR